MQYFLRFIFGLGLYLCGFSGIGQEIKVSDPKLELRNNTIHITYDILNSTPSDEFTVELVVTDSQGKRINVATLNGDVGDMVYGGNGKHITWDLEADQIEMNAQIHVKVYVKAIPPPQPVADDPPAEQVKEESRTESQEQAKAEKVKKYSRTGLVLQSVAFPGLGLSRYKGGPHWIKGVAGYGCVAGAVILNRQAVDTYAGINNLSDIDDKNALYKESQQQDNISEVLAYTAIAIWVTDLVWTIIGTSDLNMSSEFNQRLRIDSKIDPVSKTPLLAFTYKF